MSPPADHPFAHRLAHVAMLTVALLATSCTALEFGRGGAAATSRQAFLAPPAYAQMRISPDGAWLSWLAPYNGVMNVWAAPLADLTAARPLTGERERGVDRHEWAWTSAEILYEKPIGRALNHVYAVNVRTNRRRNLTPVLRNVDAKLQSLSAQRPDTALIALNTRDRTMFDLYTVDITTGERRLAAENPGGVSSWVNDNALTPRLGLRPQENASVWLQHGAGEEARPIANIPLDDALTTRPIGFGPGGRLLMLDSRERETAALVAFDVDSQTTSPIWSDAEADVRRVVRNRATGAPVAAAGGVHYLQWTALDPAYANDIAYLTAQFPELDWDIVSLTGDAGRWIIHVDDAADGGAYHLYTRAPQALQTLFRVRPPLAGRGLARAQPITLAARDGLPLTGALTLPADTPRGPDGRPIAPPPLVIIAHGGPWTRATMGYKGWRAWLAHRGYAVLNVNYRGSRGLGKRLLNAGAPGAGGSDMHNDLADAAAWAVANGVADEDRIAIVGASFGGYAAMMGLARHPDRYACGVSLAGPVSLVKLVESFPAAWRGALAPTWLRFAGDPSAVEQRVAMLARSPVGQTTTLRGPLLLAQGQDDRRAPKADTDRFVQAVTTQGAVVVYVSFLDEAHGLTRPANRDAFHGIMETFLARCLGGAVQATGPTQRPSSAQILHGGGYLNAPTGSGSAGQ